MRRRSSVLGVVLVAALVLAGCGDDDGSGVREVGDGGGSSASGSASGSGSGSASGSGSGSGAAAGCPETEPAPEGATQAEVTLTEYEVTPAEDTIAAGPVTFVAENAGAEVHELVVVRGDDPEALPVSEGQVQEDELVEGAFLGEIEGFPSGETCEGSFELEAGSYVLFCNIVETEEDGTVESHFEEGMVTTVTAE